MANVDRMGILNAQVAEAQQRLQAAKTPEESIRARSDLAALQREIGVLAKSPEYRTYEGTPGTPAPKQPAATATSAPQTAPAAVRPQVDVAGQVADIMGYITGQVEALKSSTGAQTAAATQAAESVYKTDQMLADKAYQEDLVKAQIRKQGGLDAADPANIAATTLNEVRANDAVYAVERGVYDEMASKSVLSDPIGWVLARLQLPSQAAKVNAAADRDAELQARFNRDVNITKDAQEHLKLDQAATNYALNLQGALAKFNDARAKVAEIATNSAKSGLQAGSMMLAGVQTAAMMPIQIRLAQQTERLNAENLEKKDQESQQASRVAGMFGYEGEIPKTVMDGLRPDFKQKVNQAAITGIAEPRVLVQVGKPMANNDQTALQYKTAQILDRNITATAQANQVDKRTGARRSFDDAYELAWKESIDRSIEGVSSLTAPKNPDGTPKPVFPALDKHWDSAEFNPLRADVAGFVRTTQQLVAQGAQSPVPVFNVMLDRVRLTAKYAEKGGLNDFGMFSSKYENAAVLSVVQSQVAGKNLLANGKPATDAQVAREIAQFYTAAVKYTTARNGAEKLGYRVPDNYVARLPLLEYSPMSGVHEAGGMLVDLRNPASVEEYLTAYRVSAKSANVDKSELLNNLAALQSAIPGLGAVPVLLNQVLKTPTK